jgi:RND family efflux transporter MFP subunit
MQKANPAVVGAALFGAGLSALFLFLLGLRPGGGEPQTVLRVNAAAPPRRTVVEVVSPARKDLARAITLVGSVVPWQQANLLSKTAGYLKDVRVDKGDPVRAGQLVARVDVPEARREIAVTAAQRQMAEADVRAAAAEQRAIEAQYRLAEEEIEGPRGELLAAQADVQGPRAEVAAREADRDRAQAEVETAQAELESARAQVEQARADAQAPGEELAAVRADLVRAETDLKLAQENHDRFQALRERGAVTQIQLDEKEGQLAAARSGVEGAAARQRVIQSRVRAAREGVTAAQRKADAAAARLESARKGAAAAEKQIAMAQAKVMAADARVTSARVRIRIAEAQARAARQQVLPAQAKWAAARAKTRAAAAAEGQARDLYQYAMLRAPFSGIVTHRYLDPGALIQTGASSSQAMPIVTIVQIGRMRIYADVPEPDAPFVQVGRAAAVSVKELPNETFTGRIARYTGALDPATRTMRVEVDVPNPCHRLRPGMFAAVKLTMETHRAVLTLPAETLVPEKQNTFVTIVSDGKAHKTKVETGADDGADVEIRMGLHGNEQVVLPGANPPADGAPVEIAAARSPER